MADAIGSLFDKSRFQQPPEVTIIKEFIEAKFQVAPSVAVNDKQIIISVKGSAMAGALRPYIWELTKLCGSTKRILIRIE